MGTIGKRLKSLRKAVGLSQQKLANALGVTQTTVGMWEVDKSTMTDRSVRQICATFGVLYDWLTTGNGEMFIESADSIVEYVMRDNPQFGDIERSIVRNWLRIPHDERLRILDTISKVFDIHSNDDT